MHRSLLHWTLATGIGLTALAAAQAQVCTGVAPVGNTQLSSVLVATNLTGRPLFVTAPPGDVDRIFIVEQNGRILVHHRGGSTTGWTTFLDLSARVSTLGDEMGLLGLAFDPNYATSGLFYVNYTERDAASRMFTVVARYQVSANPDVASTTETRLMIFTQPQINHNGGQLIFGPDGMLYIFTGDGGGSNDSDTGHATCGNGQSLTTPLAKILRIDPSQTATGLPDCGGLAGAPYRVPTTNPFFDGVGTTADPCDEIWGYGVRNPWRNAFDSLTGDLYVADVGQNCWEEINFVPAGTGAGRNYGWRKMEGNHCFDPNNAFNCSLLSSPMCGTTPSCNDPSLTDPVVEYNHSGTCSVTGGAVYRGCLMPNFRGAYFYGDYCGGFVKSFRMVGGAVTDEQTWTSQIDPGGSLQFQLTSFGVDGQGELYITDRGGQVSKVLPPFTSLLVSGAGSGSPFRLSREGNWSWEDTLLATWHTVDYYRVYRGTPGAAFSCIHSSLTPSWPQGDLAVPAGGQLFAYLVTAVSGAEETSSGDPPRILQNPCGAP